MQKTSLLQSGPSPCITPQCTHSKSKSVSTTRKPPSHLKKANLEAKAQKVQKRPKSRTSSYTPKPVRLNIFERGFHNSNLSDTDVSSKLVDLTYTNNKLKSSMFSKLEANCKVKETKHRKNIDKIIKKSLLRAKHLKLSQDRINKETRIEKEIKKNEICLHNKQIRMQNLMKYKKKKKIKKKSDFDQPRVLSFCGKFKNLSNLHEPGKKRKGAGSVDLNQIPLRSDHELLELVESKKGELKDENRRYMERIAAEISRASQYGKEEKPTLKSRKPKKINDSFEEDLKVERNISFIDEVSELALFSHQSDSKIEEFNYFNDSSKKMLKTSAALLIQNAFRKHLAKKYLKNQKKKLTTQTEKVSILPSPDFSLKNQKKIESFPIISKLKILSLNKTETFNIQSNFQAKPLKTTQESSISVLPKARPFLKLEKLKVFSIRASLQNKVQTIHKTLQDQIAQNFAQINIIEQLRLEELNLIESLTRASPEQGTYLTSVHGKYKTLILYLKSLSKDLQSPYLDSLSVQDYSNIKKKQQIFENSVKQQIRSSLNVNFSIPVALGHDLDFQDQGSSDLSSDEVDKIGGISHSHSMNQLFEENEQEKKKESCKSHVQFTYSIEDPFDSLIPNTDSSKDLPSLPAFNLPSFDHLSSDIPISETRILTSTESIMDFASEIMSRLNFSEILLELQKPIIRDPLHELEKIISKPIGVCVDRTSLEIPKILNISSLLQLEDSESELDSTVREIGKADMIHRKMILTVVDGILQELRPFGRLGKPLPWESNRSNRFKRLGEDDVRKKVLKELEIFSYFQIGRIFNEEIVQISGGINKEIIECLREEKLEKVILYEAVMEEENWVAYEFEEMQTILDLTDLVLESLAQEVVDTCSQ